jgi:hypothetical protein
VIDSDLYTLDVEDPTALVRMLSDGFEDWSKQAASTGFCSRPVRLFGQAHTFDRRSGQHLHTFDSRDLPDSVLYVRCGNRRASRCPSCSHEYQGDMWHLLSAGVSGGDKGVPESVSAHPLVFLTLTAPSFGAVHSSTRPGAQPRPCTVNAAPGLCGHGRPRRCTELHTADDALVGQPLCRDCYDYEGQAIWQWHCPELWRRFTIRLRRLIATHLGMSEKASRDLLRVQFAKVGEYQKRGAIHLHALVRLDGAPTGEEPFPSPAIDVPVSWLAERCLEAAQDVEVDAAPVDGNDSARALRFGRQVDARPVQRYTDDGGDVSPEMVAAYLAKYATKAAGDVAAEGAPNRHLKRLRETCLELCGRALLADGFASPYALLGKWADALGFRGHFASKSRRFSTTLGTLRDVRRKYHRDRERLETSAGSSGTADSFDVTEHTVVINEFRFLGQGWLTLGDAELARSAADAAREWKDSRRAALRLHEKGKNHGKALLHR